MTNTKVRGRYVNGRVEFQDQKPDWAEGAELDIALHRNGALDEDDEDRVETPEEIEAWIKGFLAIPPLVITPAEEAEINEWQRKVGEFTKDAVRKQFELGIEGAP